MINLYKKGSGADGRGQRIRRPERKRKVSLSGRSAENPNVLEYGGSQAAEIVDFTIEDENGVAGNTIEKMSTVYH